MLRTFQMTLVFGIIIESYRDIELRLKRLFHCAKLVILYLTVFCVGLKPIAIIKPLYQLYFPKSDLSGTFKFTWQANQYTKQTLHDVLTRSSQ